MKKRLTNKRKPQKRSHKDEIAHLKKIIELLEVDKRLLQEQVSAIGAHNVGLMDLMRDTGALQASLRNFLGLK